MSESWLVWEGAVRLMQSNFDGCPAEIGAVSGSHKRPTIGTPSSPLAPLGLQHSRVPARHEMGLVRVTDLFLQNPGGLQGAKAGEKEGATTRDWRGGTTEAERKHHGMNTAPQGNCQGHSITGYCSHPVWLQ